MKCEFCGTEDTADAKFCMQCGKEILTEESLEEKADDSSALIYCKECGAENSIDSDFCYACGAKLQKDETDSGNSDEEAVKWVTPETEETIKWFMLGADALSKGG